MIHPADKGAVYAEHTFDLGRMGELELGVDVAGVLDRPALMDVLVYRPAVGPELAPWRDLLEQEPDDVGLVGVAVEHDGVCELSGAFLLREHKRRSFEVCLVHLYDAFEHVGFGRQVRPECAVPATHGPLGKPGEGRGLEHGLAYRPAPEEHPPDLERELQVREPGVREEREAFPAASAAIPLLFLLDLARPAPRTEYVLAKGCGAGTSGSGPPREFV